MSRAVLVFALVLMCAIAPASAIIGTVDDVPAATLLLPYFEVDLERADGITTLFSINNASATAILAHVVLWTDLSVPTLDFNVYLTGYDVVTFNLRDLFNGTVPATASDGQDPADTISPQGPFSQDINFASCSGQLPLPNLPPVLLNHVRAAHTGQPSSVFLGDCGGIDHGDAIARGYVTIDTVNSCSLQFPGDPGYFSTVATFQNALLGDYYYVIPEENFAQGETMVHVEADLGGLGAGNYTFYRRYGAGEDMREGLANTFFVRYVSGGNFSGGTDLVVWRDAKRTIAPFTCGTLPAPYPLSQNQIVIFDEEENPDVPEQSPFSPVIPGDFLAPFPWEANRVAVGGPDFPVPFQFGWLYLNLNSTVAGSQVPFEPIMQNWVTVVSSAEGRYSVGFDAFQLSNVTFPGAASDQLIGF